jgi:hypothetical protein
MILMTWIRNQSFLLPIRLHLTGGKLSEVGYEKYLYNDEYPRGVMRVMNLFPSRGP